MIASTRVIFNTSVQYLRTGITLIVSLYTTRLILEALGVEDYGIYSLVGGIVSMLSFLKSSLAGTTQRYLSYHQGKQDLVMQKKIFNNSVVTQLLISIGLIIILISISPLLFNGFLNIPPYRTDAAIWVYFCMLGTLFFTMQSTPYMAALIAHENILYATIVQVIGTFLKIPIALSLIWFQFDSLKLYAILLLSVEILNFALYYFYCHNKYAETVGMKFLSIDKATLREMFSFMWWVIYGNGCIVGRTQGIAVMLNKFFGTALNAAYGLSLVVSSQLSFLSSSLGNAINPQIIRAEGNGDRKKMLRLAEVSSKFSFLLLALVSIPAIIEMNSLLTFWLKEVPEYAVVFAQFVVLANLFDQLTIGLIAANKAIGNIRLYSLTINTIKILTLPAAFISLYIGLPVYSVMVLYAFFELICALARLPFLRITGGLSIKGFAKRVFIKMILPVTLTVLAVLTYNKYIYFPWSFIGSFIISAITLSFSSYFVGLCKDEKDIIKGFVNIVIVKAKLI